MTIEAQHSSPPLVGPETHGLLTDGEFMTTQEFIETISVHLDHVEFAHVPGGAYARLNDSEYDPFNWEDPHTWNSTPQKVARYEIMLDPSADTDLETITIAFLLQLKHVREDIARRTGDGQSLSSPKELAEQERKDFNGALGFYRENTQLVDSCFVNIRRFLPQATH